MVLWILVQFYQVEVQSLQRMDTQISLQPLNESNGVLFIEGEEIAFTSTAWQLVFTLNFSSIHQDILTIGNIIRRVAENVGTEVDLKMVVKANHSYQRVVAEYEELLTKTEVQNPIKRDERSIDPLHWISGAFGSIARQIFGVATETEVQKIEAYLRMVDQEREQLATFRKIHLTAIKIMEGQIERQRLQVQHLTNVTELLIKNVLPDRENRKKLSSNLLLIYGEIDNMISSLHLMVNSLQEAIQDIELGRLSRKLFPIKELRTAIQHIADKMPYHTRPVYGVENGMEQYYRNPLVWKLPGNRVIRGILRIPLQTADQMFTTYQAVPFPMHLPSDPSRRIKLQGGKRLIATTKNHKKFLNLDHWEPASTCLNSQPKVCPVSQATQVGVGQDCLFQLIGSAHLIKSTTCEYDEVMETYEEIVAINDEQWAISTGQPISMEAGCMDPEDPAKPVETMETATIKGNQLLKIPPSCTAVVGDHVIPLRLKIASTQETKFGLTKTPFLDNDLKTEIESLATEKLYQKIFFQAYSQISRLKVNISTEQDSRKVYEMIKEMSKIDDEVAKLQPLWATHYFNLGIWPVVIMVVIGWILIKVQCLKRCKNNHQAEMRVDGYQHPQVAYRPSAPVPVDLNRDSRPRRDPIYE